MLALGRLFVRSRGLRQIALIETGDVVEPSSLAWIHRLQPSRGGWSKLPPWARCAGRDGL